MIAQIEKRLYTAEEYLELEIASDIRSEYQDGKIIPLTGGLPNHNDVVGNLYILLKLALRHQNYNIFLLDQRLWIPEVKLYTYPDVMVLPKPIELQPGRRDTVMNPCFVVEVLSKSTQNYDRGKKFVAYRSMPNFREYLLIDQHRVHVEHHVKTAVNQWLFSEYDDPAVMLSLDTFGVEVAIADLYEGIDFSEEVGGLEE
jgi:Uma2 family endonuclease